MSDPDTIYQQRPPAVLTFGTPASPATTLDACEREDCGGYAVRGTGRACRHADCPLHPKLEPPPIVTIRPAGEHGSELYVRTGDGAQLVVVPLSWGHLICLLEDAAAGLRRHKED